MAVVHDIEYVKANRSNHTFVDVDGSDKTQAVFAGGPWLQNAAMAILVEENDGKMPQVIRVTLEVLK